MLIIYLHDNLSYFIQSTSINPIKNLSFITHLIIQASCEAWETFIPWPRPWPPWLSVSTGAASGSTESLRWLSGSAACGAAAAWGMEKRGWDGRKNRKISLGLDQDGSNIEIWFFGSWQLVTNCDNMMKSWWNRNLKGNKWFHSLNKYGSNHVPQSLHVWEDVKIHSKASNSQDWCFPQGYTDHGLNSSMGCGLAKGLSKVSRIVDGQTPYTLVQ